MHETSLAHCAEQFLPALLLQPRDPLPVLCEKLHLRILMPGQLYNILPALQARGFYGSIVKAAHVQNCLPQGRLGSLVLRSRLCLGLVLPL